MPNYNNVLGKHKIASIQRTRMINWMIEVISNYKSTTSNETFVYSVQIMDQFLKLSLKQYLDKDIHLIGITCIYIASKQVDIYHIPLTQVFDKIGHKKFTMEQIKEKESEILQVLKFNFTFPSTLKFLNRILFKNFYKNSSLTLKNIYETSLMVLKMTLYDDKMYIFQPFQLAVGIAIYSLKSIFQDVKMSNQC